MDGASVWAARSARDAMSDLFDDDLEYGVVLHRFKGGWWHGHLVRTTLRYPCTFLGRRTTMLLCIQKLGRGGIRLSKLFFVTLDGEGVLSDARFRYTSQWHERVGPREERVRARRSRDCVLASLQETEAFQRAVAHVIQNERYEVMADISKAEWVEVPTPLAEEGLGDA